MKDFVRNVVEGAVFVALMLAIGAVCCAASGYHWE